MSDEKRSSRRFKRYDEDEESDAAVLRRLGNTREPTRLSQPLERLVRNLGAPPISILSQLEDRWPDIVGPALSATTRPVELVDGVLVVACQEAGWASQISWMEGQIKQRFDEVFGPGSEGDSGPGLLKRVSVRVDR